MERSGKIRKYSSAPYTPWLSFWALNSSSDGAERLPNLMKVSLTFSLLTFWNARTQLRSFIRARTSSRLLVILQLLWFRMNRCGKDILELSEEVSWSSKRVLTVSEDWSVLRPGSEGELRPKRMNVESTAFFLWLWVPSERKRNVKKKI